MKKTYLPFVAISLIAVFSSLIIYKKSNESRITSKPPQELISNIEIKKEFSLEDAIESINKTDLRKYLEYLASPELEGRMSGKRGNIAAFAYIKQKYESFGLPTMYQKFPISRLNPGPKNEKGDDFSQNVYAWIEGNELKDEIVIIGAHGDHVGYGPSMSRSPNRREVHPGADDNGSGTVGLLEVAQAFSMLKNKVKRTVVFQSYSAEEMGLIGSRYYCSNPLFPLNSPSMKNHIAMINLDMIGYLNPSFKVSDTFTSDMRGLVDVLSSRYPFAKSISGYGPGPSDHSSFFDKKVPIVFLHTGFHKAYHTPDDTVDKINFDGLEKVSRYAFELAWMVCQAEGRPKFN